MDLQQVDVVGTKTFEGAFDLIEDGLAGESCFLPLASAINLERGESIPR